MISANDDRSTNPPTMRYIRRMVKIHRGGWCVVIKRATKTWTKYFSDTACGDEQRALQMAQAWRDAMLPSISGAEYEVWKREHSLQSREANTSGVVGVSRNVVRVSRRGKVEEWPYWQAYWHGLDGKRRSRSFSIRKHGESQAWEMACNARREGLADVAREAAQRDESTSPAMQTVDLRAKA